MESRRRIRENLEFQKQDQMKKLKEEKKMIDFEVKKLEFMNLPKLESDFNNSGFVLTCLTLRRLGYVTYHMFTLGRALGLVWDILMRDKLCRISYA